MGRKFYGQKILWVEKFWEQRKFMFRQLFSYYLITTFHVLLHVALVTRCYVVAFTRLFSSGNYNTPLPLYYTLGNYNLFSPNTIQYINSKTPSRFYKPLYFTIVYKTTLPTITSPLKAILQHIRHNPIQQCQANLTNNTQIIHK